MLLVAFSSAYLTAHVTAALIGWQATAVAACALGTGLLVIALAHSLEGDR